MQIMNEIILKIRDFIIGFRIKKYSYSICKLHVINESYKWARLIVARQCLKQTVAYMTAALGYTQIGLIQAQSAKTGEEKKKKALAIAEAIINTQLAAMKACNSF